jgi:uncharacterized membrane protein YqjE
MEESASPPPGRLESIRRIGDSALAILWARLELVSLELREEKLRALDLLLRAAAAAVFGLLTMISATALVVLLFWSRSPVLTLALLTALYALATVAIGWSLKKRLESSPSPFANTVAEFKKDCECWPKKP